MYCDCRSAHLRMSLQMALNLAWFDPKSAQLSLLVKPAQKGQCTVGIPPHSITRAIHSLIAVLDKTLAGESGQAKIAAGKSGSADPQLARYPHRERLPVPIGNHHLNVVDRPANRWP
jgi:hypothetical protein